MIALPPVRDFPQDTPRTPEQRARRVAQRRRERARTLATEVLMLVGCAATAGAPTPEFSPVVAVCEPLFVGAPEAASESVTPRPDNGAPAEADAPASVLPIRAVGVPGRQSLTALADLLVSDYLRTRRS